MPPLHSPSGASSLRWPAVLTIGAFGLQLPFEAMLSARGTSILALEQMRSSAGADAILALLDAGAIRATAVAFALDYLFIAAWVWWFWRGTARYAPRWGNRGRALARGVRGAVVVAAVADSVENALALAVLDGARGSFPTAVTVAADVKLLALAGALLTVSAAAVTHRSRSRP